MGKTKIDEEHAFNIVRRHHSVGIGIKETAYKLGISPSRVTQFRKSLGLIRTNHKHSGPSEVLWLRVSLEMKSAMASARGNRSISGYIRNLIEADLEQRMGRSICRSTISPTHVD